MTNYSAIPTQINIAPRGKSWLAGKLLDGADGHQTWEGMQSQARKTLIAHAEGRVQHVHAGSCPSVLEGHDKRDDGCPVCQALMALEAA